MEIKGKPRELYVYWSRVLNEDFTLIKGLSRRARRFRHAKFRDCPWFSGIIMLQYAIRMTIGYDENANKDTEKNNV